MFASHFFVRWSFLVVALDRFFFIWETKKKRLSLVALNWWSSYTVTILREFAWADSALVVLQRRSSEHVWLQCFKLIENNFVCLMEKWVQIFKCTISHSSTKSLVLPSHKFAIRNLDIFFPFFGKLNLLNSAVYLLTCQYFERMEKSLSRRKEGLHFPDFLKFELRRYTTKGKSELNF